MVNCYIRLASVQKLQYLQSNATTALPRNHTVSITHAPPHRTPLMPIATDPSSVPTLVTSQVKISHLPYNTICLKISLVHVDADNCMRYHYCYGVGYPADTHECDSERIYDAEAKGCVIGVAKRCEKNTCPKKAGVSVAMKPNAAYYMFCDVSPYGWTQKVVLRCQLEDTHVFDATTQTCEFNCKAAGEFTDRKDCHKYHSCTKKGTKFTYNHYSCSSGFYFNGVRCEQQTEECIPQIPVPPKYVPSTGEVRVNITDVESAELGSGEPTQEW